MTTKVAIQGQQASFHDLAVRQFFHESVKLVCRDTFAGVFKALEANEANFGVVAIENSLYGSINEVYDLLLKNHFWISGEVYLRVAQCLIGLPGAKLETIEEVHTQAPAFGQCEEFLDTQLPGAKRVEQHDTSASVGMVKEWNDPKKAAIASRVAAELYGLEVLAEEIETNKQNYTRFVVMQKQTQTLPDATKASLVLKTPTDDRPGALFRALSIFASDDLNLTMLQSRPVIGKAWHYLFYLDVSDPQLMTKLPSVIEKLEQQDCKITVLGMYRAA